MWKSMDKNRLFERTTGDIIKIDRQLVKYNTIILSHIMKSFKYWKLHAYITYSMWNNKSVPQHIPRQTIKAQNTAMNKFITQNSNKPNCNPED